jgi:hypothetical protein
MALTKEFYDVVEGFDIPLSATPLCFDRAKTLRILAVLRASSCARSAVEGDDKLPTPVFEKLGSGL